MEELCVFLRGLQRWCYLGESIVWGPGLYPDGLKKLISCVNFVANIWPATWTKWILGSELLLLWKYLNTHHYHLCWSGTLCSLLLWLRMLFLIDGFYSWLYWYIQQGYSQVLLTQRPFCHCYGREHMFIKNIGAELNTAALAVPHVILPLLI